MATSAWVVAIARDRYLVAIDGEDRPAALAGRFRRLVVSPEDLPAVGDLVELAPNVADGVALITGVRPRRSAVVRTASDSNRREGGHLRDHQVLAANVDLVFVVDALDPGPNPRRLERYLALGWSSGALPIVLLNKADRAVAIDDRVGEVAAVAPGVAVHVISALTGAGMTAVEEHLVAGRTAVFLGPSGVGKSTIVNRLLGHARQATGEIRLRDGRGRHTTTTRELMGLPGGGFVIDTPGIRSLELLADEASLERVFADIADLAAGCRFSDCRHGSEPGCAVRAAAEDGRLAPERLDSLRKLAREARRTALLTDQRAAAEQRRRGRLFERAARAHYRVKYGEPS